MFLFKTALTAKTESVDIRNEGVDYGSLEAEALVL
jgi:hypothetical protein